MLQGNHSHWRWILVTLTYDFFMSSCSQPLCIHMLFRKCFNWENLKSILTDVTNTTTINILLRSLVFFFTGTSILRVVYTTRMHWLTTSIGDYTVSCSIVECNNTHHNNQQHDCGNIESGSSSRGIAPTPLMNFSGVVEHN